ncbi:MAG: FMN-binding protein [Saonia sp.]
MKTKIALLLLVSLVWNCKQKPNTEKLKIQSPQEQVETTEQIPSAIRDIVSFAAVPVTDTTDIAQLIQFKEIGKNGVLRTINTNKFMKLYRALMDSKTIEVFPILEMKNTDKAVLFANGKGYGGTIWAQMLVDRSTGEIEKIQFDHKAESEGYGDGITQTSFEKQFMGTKISFNSNTFGLQQGGQNVLKGNIIVDGASGATTTNQAAVDMINKGLQKYETYFNRMSVTYHSLDNLE